jgi:hypothetical protein
VSVERGSDRWHLSLKIARITALAGLREDADGLGDHLRVADCEPHGAFGIDETQLKQVPASSAATEETTGHAPARKDDQRRANYSDA